MAKRCIYADDFLDLFYVASAGQDKMFVKVVKQVIEDTPTVNVVEVRDCEQCIHFSKRATEYPCSHCRNCYPDKFQPNDTRTLKERGSVNS